MRNTLFLTPTQDFFWATTNLWAWTRRYATTFVALARRGAPAIGRGQDVEQHGVAGRRPFGWPRRGEHTVPRTVAWWATVREPFDEKTHGSQAAEELVDWWPSAHGRCERGTDGDGSGAGIGSGTVYRAARRRRPLLVGTWLLFFLFFFYVCATCRRLGVPRMVLACGAAPWAGRVLETRPPSLERAHHGAPGP